MPTKEEIRASLEAFMKRRRYASFDRATLDAIADDELELAINDYVATQFNDDLSDEERTLRKLSPGFRAIYLTLDVEGEVFNGGFSQYFENAEAVLTQMTIDGFRTIGAPEYAELLTRASDAWRLDHELDRFDTEFRELAEVSNLSQMRIAFIRMHPEQFVTEG